MRFGQRQLSLLSCYYGDCVLDGSLVNGRFLRFSDVCIRDGVFDLFSFSFYGVGRGSFVYCFVWRTSYSKLGFS